MNAHLDVAARHPLGRQARVLLASVFGPYAQDDPYGSRVINPMELYQNQVTRVQGGFSLRTFHRSWGMMMIQANLKAPCTLLDFPTQERFLQELTTKTYDVIGIGSIMTNLLKVRRMCKLIRKHQPQASIVIGGHIANIPELERWISADHVVRGEGVRWMRDYLGEETDRPLRHPVVRGNLGTRIMGMTLREMPGDLCATLIPSVGCPLGCNFCSTSALFGGKGRFIEFYQTGQDLFEIMCALEAQMGIQAFFVMDENFLLDQPRALQLLQLMERYDKAWSLYLFSSANILQKYEIEQLVALGVSWVWLGLEGKNSRYTKLKNTDTHQLVRLLQSHGIRVLGSSIIGLEEHTPENIDEAIDHAVAHDTEFHQFMLYTPIPGTPLFAEHERQNRLRNVAEIPMPDIHGQYQFNYIHPHIPPGQETEFLLRAFRRDFAVNGPSAVRIVRTVLRGWKRYQNHPDQRIRARFAYEAANLPVRYAGVLWASREFFRDDPHRYRLIDDVLTELGDVLGPESLVTAERAGRYMLRRLRQEEDRLREGWTYEPQTYYETNSLQSNPDAELVEGILPGVAPAAPLPPRFAAHQPSQAL